MRENVRKSERPKNTEEEQREEKKAGREETRQKRKEKRKDGPDRPLVSQTRHAGKEGKRRTDRKGEGRGRDRKGRNNQEKEGISSAMITI